MVDVDACRQELANRVYIAVARCFFKRSDLLRGPCDVHLSALLTLLTWGSLGQIEMQAESELLMNGQRERCAAGRSAIVPQALVLSLEAKKRPKSGKKWTS